MKRKTVSEIKELLTGEPGEADILAIRKDSRKGVRKLLAAYDRTVEKEARLARQFTEMSVYEKDRRKNGYTAIAGVDEVGRGPLAGPVIAASVILPEDFYLPGLNDSKKLSEEKRESYAEYIKTHALAWGTGAVSAGEIDRLNIYQASKLAMQRAVHSMETDPDFLLVDAMELPENIPQTSLIKGDSRSISIAAASVIAKVKRDSCMKGLDSQYPGYAFGQNMGYGTRDHLAGLKNHGATPEHRKTFAPVREFL
ncbi:ribonuclease HII [Alteribacter natronophilus]|uniref:ribonuclease HII n=1 Tax=Alteribacter natronophilus TaxID=2583810 RepID=UPI00110F4C17|nr:ribonuclease HII [Alteribacter natronophilus]